MHLPRSIFLLSTLLLSQGLAAQTLTMSLQFKGKTVSGGYEKGDHQTWNLDRKMSFSFPLGKGAADSINGSDIAAQLQANETYDADADPLVQATKKAQAACGKDEQCFQAAIMKAVMDPKMQEVLKQQSAKPKPVKDYLNFSGNEFRHPAITVQYQINDSGSYKISDLSDQSTPVGQGTMQRAASGQMQSKRFPLVTQRISTKAYSINLYGVGVDPVKTKGSHQGTISGENSLALNINSSILPFDVVELHKVLITKSPQTVPLKKGTLTVTWSVQ
jgi:hypothetical protein